MQWDVEALKAQMTRHRFSNRKLAQKAGISASHVTRILNGDRGGRPRWETVLRLAAALEVDPSTLIVGTVVLPPDPPPSPPKRQVPARKRTPRPEPTEPWAVNEWTEDDEDEEVDAWA